MYYLLDLAARNKHDICAILFGPHILVGTFRKEI